MRGPHYRQLFCFNECGGFFVGQKFLEWIREKLAAKGVAEGATLADMFAQKGVDLSLVATDTTDVEMLVLNHRTAPGVPVEWAVRMSMSIPFVWREVVWQAAWGQSRGRDKLNAEGGGGNIIVDGGVLSNFPIHLVADPAPVDLQDIMGDTDPNAAGSLGLLIDENLSVAGGRADAQAAAQDQRPALHSARRSPRGHDDRRAGQGRDRHARARGLPSAREGVRADRVRHAAGAPRRAHRGRAAGDDELPRRTRILTRARRLRSSAPAEVFRGS